MGQAAPMARRPGGAGAGDPAPEPAERARVLVVDDDEHNLLAIRTVLEDIAEVVTAHSGEEALRHLLRSEFAVILLDVYMPGMDGYETAAIIRGREQTKRIPIIFLSAVNKETEHLIRGYSMGAVDYVFKPVEPIVLQSKVTVFVDLFMMTREIRRKAQAEQRLQDANLRANAERLRAEQELRIAEQRQSAIIQSLPIMFYLEELNSSPRMLKFASGNLVALTGFTLEEVQASPALWDERLHPDDRDRVAHALTRRSEGQSFAVEYRWQCADGRYRHFLDQTVLLRDNEGAPLEYAGSLLDITERRDLETQLLHVRKMDAIGKLTGGIAHDFNNLLAAVLGGIGMIERRVTLNEEQRKILAMTRRAAEQGTELVGRLLAFARRQKLAPARIELSQLATSISQLMEHTLGGLVELIWETGEEAWAVYADEAQLELALMNLIINARDAMPEGGAIRVRSDNRAVDATNDLGLAAGDYVVLSVEDTGCGIAPDLLERVMEPFFTTKDIGKGTGLGLSMVYGFVQQSGGTLRIESRKDEGTSVALWLPRAPEDGVPLPAPSRNGTLALQPASALKILLVDDHDGVRATMTSLLEDLGHVVVPTMGGDAMLKTFKNDPAAFDLIISDYAMPKLSGVELIHRARRIRPSVPAIIITGYADSSSIGESPTDVPVLTKPFTAAQLSHAIGTIFS